MGLRIQTNQLAVSANRNLGEVQRQLQKTIQRMSSGTRIVEASDDPAGLALSDSLNATIRSLGSAIRNAQDGISLIQVFEGGTNELNNMMVRIRELAMQAASDTVGERERAMLQNEAGQLVQEVDRIARTTKYSGRNLLSGDDIKIAIQVGVQNDDNVDRIVFDPGDTSLTSEALKISDIDISDKINAQEALEKLDEALTRVNEIRARVGAVQNRLNTTIVAQSIFQENLMAAKSRIKDADMAQEAANLAKESILRKAGVAVLTQANETPALALQLLHT